jgi:Family of unknown function (DUF6632)
MKVEESVQMMVSLYVTLGIFLLLAARNPAEHRSLIAFAAWSSFAHAGVVAVQVSRNLIPRGELTGVESPLQKAEGRRIIRGAGRERGISHPALRGSK